MPEVQQRVDEGGESRSKVSVTAPRGTGLGQEMLMDGPLLEVPPAQQTVAPVLTKAASQSRPEPGGQPTARAQHRQGWARAAPLPPITVPVGATQLGDGRWPRLAC